MVKDRKGFSLIELLIAVAIIGILASIAVPLYLGHQKKAAFAEAKSNLEAIRLLEEAYFAENARYTPDPDATVTDAGITAVLPAFQPGIFANLKYTYSLQTLNGGTQFIAIATGKATTNATGSVFSINDRNEKSW